MKKLFIIIAILAVTTMMAQEKTMFGSSPDISHGGFGAPVVKFTSINGEFGVGIRTLIPLMKSVCNMTESKILDFLYFKQNQFILTRVFKIILKFDSTILVQI